MKLREVIQSALNKQVLNEGQADNLVRDAYQWFGNIYEQVANKILDENGKPILPPENYWFKAVKPDQTNLPTVDYQLTKKFKEFKRVLKNSHVPNSWMIYYAHMMVGWSAITALAFQTMLVKAVRNPPKRSMYKMSGDEMLISLVGQMSDETKNYIESHGVFTTKQERKLYQKAASIIQNNDTVTPSQAYNAEVLIFSHLVPNLQHYAGINYQPIQDFNPLEMEGDTMPHPHHVRVRLDSLEQEYIDMKKEMGENYIPLTGDEKWVIKSGEYKWLDLDNWCSRIDGDLMRHCGNSYGDQNDRVYVLNSIKSTKGGQEHRKPHMFVVVQRGGLVGEAKGYGNSLPKEEYQEAFYDFLMSDIVNGFSVKHKHAPENDMKITDLTIDQIRNLAEHKSEQFFRSAIETVRKVGAWRRMDPEKREQVDQIIANFGGQEG